MMAAQTQYLIRKEQLDRLTKSQQMPVTLIRAPSGYGKTILCEQWAAQLQTPVVWVQLSAQTRDANIFDLEIMTALRDYCIATATSKSGAYKIEDLPECFDPLPHVTLFIDDVHLLYAFPEAIERFETFINNRPCNLHLVLISQTTLDFIPYDHLAAQGKVIGFGSEDIKFTLSEVHALADAMQANDHTATFIDWLYERLDGWPLGIHLALSVRDSTAIKAALAGSIDIEQAFNRLADCLLKAMPYTTQTYLLRASILQEISPEIWAHIMGLSPQDQDMWASFSTQGFLKRAKAGFIIPRRLRRFLYKKLHTEHSQIFKEVHQRAAIWYDERGNLDRALFHYVQGQHLEEAFNLVENAVVMYYNRGDTEILLRWQELLQPYAENVPELQRLCGAIYIDRLDYDNARQSLDAAKKGYAARQNELGVMRVDLHFAMIALQTNDVQTSLEIAQRCLPETEQKNNTYGKALRIIGRSYLRLGELEKAQSNLEQALEAYEAHGDPYALSVLLLDLMVIYQKIDDLEKAEACLQKARGLRGKDRDTSAFALLLNNLAYHYHMHYRYISAYNLASEGLDLAQKHKHSRAEGYLHWTMGDLLRDCGHWEAAKKHYEQALYCAEAQQDDQDDPNSEETLLHMSQVNYAWLARWKKDYQFARMLLTDQLAWAEDVSENCLAWGVWAACELDEHWDEQADGVLQTCMAHFLNEKQYPEWMQMITLGLSSAARRQDQNHLRHFVKMLSSVESQIIDKHLQPLLAEMLNVPELNAMLREKLFWADHRMEEKLRGLSQANLPLSCISPEILPEIDLPVRIRIEAFGEGIVYRDGILIEKWESNQAREIFFCLYYKGPQSKDDLIHLFWPDYTSPKHARDNLSTTIARARRAVGHKTIIHEDGYYQINEAVDIEADTQLFDLYYQEMQVLPLQHFQPQEQGERAAALYKDRFLKDFYSDWIVNLQHVYEIRCYEILVNAGHSARLNNQLWQALDYYERALAINPDSLIVREAIKKTHQALKNHLRDDEDDFDPDDASSAGDQDI